MKYTYIRTCECGNIREIKVSKKEAAFRLKDREIFNLKCEKCGKIRLKLLSREHPDLDKELLLEWVAHEDYAFMSQDEELILADVDNIDLILDVLDNYKILSFKRNILIQALCVIIYDNSRSQTKNLEIVNRVATELYKRKQDVLAAQEGITDSIKAVVFPIIGIDKNELTC